MAGMRAMRCGGRMRRQPSMAIERWRFGDGSKAPPNFRRESGQKDFAGVSGHFERAFNKFAALDNPFQNLNHYN
jgi:hypothetical protein